MKQTKKDLKALLNATKIPSELYKLPTTLEQFITLYLSSLSWCHYEAEAGRNRICCLRLTEVSLQLLLRLMGDPFGDDDNT